MVLEAMAEVFDPDRPVPDAEPYIGSYYCKNDMGAHLDGDPFAATALGVRFNFESNFT
jgi:hypothetical protein